MALTGSLEYFALGSFLPSPIAFMPFYKRSDFSL